MNTSLNWSYYQSFYSLCPVLIPFPLDFGQHVIKSPQLRGNGVYLDPDSVRVHPRHSGALQGLKALALPPDVGKAPDGARQPRLRSVCLDGNLTAIKVAVLWSLQSLLKLSLQQLIPPFQFVNLG